MKRSQVQVLVPPRELPQEVPPFSTAVGFLLVEEPRSGVARPRAGCGALAQLVERLLCKQEVRGSIPLGSTKRNAPAVGRFALCGLVAIRSTGVPAAPVPPHRAFVDGCTCVETAMWRPCRWGVDSPRLHVCAWVVSIRDLRSLLDRRGCGAARWSRYATCGRYSTGGWEGAARPYRCTARRRAFMAS